VKLRCQVAYDGTDYFGFQVQPGKRTIQSELEQALRAITQEDTRMVPAGRTDAGVHALGQVVHFEANWRHTAPELERALNALLPTSIAVASMEAVSPDFHARYDATSRRYRYQVWNSPVRCPLNYRYTLHYPLPLMVERMCQALQYILGDHDFRAFAGGEEPNSVTVRRVEDVRCERHGDLIVIEVEANAFVRHMMRRLVGTLLEIGEGKHAPEFMSELLASGDKARAGPTVPARGLCLVRVLYNERQRHHSRQYAVEDEEA